MIVFPAIDLKDGCCVRLYQGDYAQTTLFSTHPEEVARRWEEAGASWLHLVDLDGAASGTPRNRSAIRGIVRAITIPVQVGGGIRDLATVEELLAMGVARIILGTVAVENQALLADLCRAYGERIAVALDSRDGYVAIHGWLRQSSLPAAELAVQVVKLGASRLICTDIARDGTLTEPNYAVLRQLVQAAGVPVIASGGVSGLAHLRRLKEIGVEGAIVGRALYTGDVDLAEAVSLVERDSPSRAAGAS